MDKHQVAPLAIIVLACLLVTLGVFKHVEFTQLIAFGGMLVSGAFALLNSGRNTVPDGNTTSTTTTVTVPPPAIVAPDDMKG